jgi:Zn-dependent alcohol dehydrogenase
VRAAILEEFGKPLVVEEVELRPPGPGEVIVRIEATSVCISDALAAHGVSFAPPPTILGHAAAGVVEEVGAGVTRVQPGQRAVVAATPECGGCYWCVRDQPAWCEELTAGVFPPRFVATRADGSQISADGGTGAYAEKMNVREIGVVAVEPRAERRAVAARIGATHLVDPEDGDPVEQVLTLTGGGGVDYGLEAAGPSEAMVQAFMMTRRAGTVVTTGMTRDSMTETITRPAMSSAWARGASTVASTAARTAGGTSRASRGCSRPVWSTPARSSPGHSRSTRSTMRSGRPRSAT